MGQDPAHCSRCSGGTVRLSLQDLLEGISGQTFRQVIQHHVRRYPSNELQEALTHTRRSLRQTRQTALEAAAQKEAGRVIRDDLWTKPAEDVITQALERIAKQETDLTETETIDIGEMIILEVALALSQQEKLRQQAGVEAIGWLGVKWWRLWTAALGSGLMIWGGSLWMEGLGLVLLAVVASSLVARWQNWEQDGTEA